MNSEKICSVLKSIQNDLFLIKKNIYDVCNLDFNNLKIDEESVEYGACSFELNKCKVIYRASKITPTKIGQFVTVWKRNEKGITAPFNSLDDIDFIIITAKNGENIGQFIFPKHLLIKQKIITNNSIDGKRGIRVYPPWDKVISKQAEKTQKWQNEYFITILNNYSFDKAKTLKIINKT